MTRITDDQSVSEVHGVPSTMLVTLATRVLAPIDLPSLGFRDVASERMMKSLGVDPRSMCKKPNMLLGTTCRAMFADRVARDIYPIIATNQAEAHPDRQKRFDAAYTRLYRMTRDTPRWHPDLVEATRKGNVLGALAAGGPFAKLLQRVRPDADEYVIDLQHLRNYPVRPGLHHLGSAVHYTASGGSLVVTGIEYDGETIKPDGPRWEIAERRAQAALATHLTVWRQGMEYHVGGLSALPVLTHNYLPASHPLRRLLAPHLTQWITTRCTRT